MKSFHDCKGEARAAAKRLGRASRDHASLDEVMRLFAKYTAARLRMEMWLWDRRVRKRDAREGSLYYVPVTPTSATPARSASV